jgi:hypothetical protein
MVPVIRVLLIELTVVIGLGVLLALIGPYGSFDAPLADRLFYWVGLGVAGLLLFRPTMAAASSIARNLDLPEAAVWAAGCFIATLPMSLIVWLAAPGRPARFPTASELLLLYANVLVLAAAVTTMFWFLKGPTRPPSGQFAKPDAGAGSLEGTAEPRFFERLPPHLGRDLLALEMEDHYVRAHTRLGSTLILMRMRDAVAELEGMEGLQVHRSWWVARAAVDGHEREGRNLRLVLSNGLQAPVARSSLAGLRAQGWIQAEAEGRPR